MEATVQLPAGSRIEVKAASSEPRGVGRLGDVEVGRLTGPAEISTASGDIRITEAVRGTVALRTRSGDISGDISVGAAAGVSAAPDARTDRGRISDALKNDGATDLDIRATTARGDFTARGL